MSLSHSDSQFCLKSWMFSIGTVPAFEMIKLLTIMIECTNRGSRQTGAQDQRYMIESVAKNKVILEMEERQRGKMHCLRMDRFQLLFQQVSVCSVHWWRNPFQKWYNLPRSNTQPSIFPVLSCIFECPVHMAYCWCWHHTSRWTWSLRRNRFLGFPQSPSSCTSPSWSTVVFSH